MKVSLTAKQIRLTLVCLKGELEGEYFDRKEQRILERAEHNLLKALYLRTREEK